MTDLRRVREGEVESSEALARAAQGGDQRALERLLSRHKHEVYRVALRMTGAPHDADEVVQAALERAMRYVGRYDGTRPFRPWLMRITVNQARTYLKKRSLREWLFGDRSSDVPEIVARGPDWHLSRKQVREHIERALAQLPIAQREVFILKHIEGLSYDEIAKITGRSLGASKVAGHRARRALMELLRAAGVTLGRVDE